MKIEIEQFVLESNKEHGFDLFEKFEGKKGQTRRLIGYNYSIKGAFKAMTHQNICKQDVTVDFYGYLTAYREEVKRLEALSSLVD